MQRSRVVMGLMVSLALFGCGHRPETGESIAEVCHPLNNGKLMHVSGYIGTSETTTSCTTTCMLQLRAQRTADSREMGLTFSLGSDNDQLEELPPNFTEADIRIKDHSGKTIKGGGVARISGRMSVSGHDRNVDCSMLVSRVEAL